jgi:serine/threonine-protein kinase
MVTGASARLPEDATIPEVGAIFDGKFRIDGVLGQGGMAVVLAATHLQLEQRVAIKLLLPSSAGDPEVVARFLVEGRSASKIRSEHVVRVLDVGMADEHPYLVMEYLDGTDLDVLLSKGGPLPSELAVDYVLQACEAIAEAHLNGIVHRDLKPANLFLTHRADGAASVKVLDFGISKLLQSHRSVVLSHETSPLLIMGSPHYMSPEHMQSASSVDQRSDIWSLGAILHELVAGKPPFEGESITALCAAILMAPPPALLSRHGDVAPALGAVVRRCLEKDPASRFADVAQLAAALAPLASPAGRASAICIERVLDGGSDSDRGDLRSRPTVPLFTGPPSPTAAETLASGPRRLAPKILRHFAVALVLLGAFSSIGWALARTHAGESAREAQVAGTSASPAKTESNVTAPAPVSAAVSAGPPAHGHRVLPSPTPRGAPSPSEAAN